MHTTDLLMALTQKELKVRYKHHAFGYLWSIANPLAYATIYFLVFKLVMKIDVENFPIFLVSGLFPWQWIANSLGVGPMTFIGNAPLIKKINFPRNFLSLVVVIQDMIHYLASIPIIIILMALFKIYPSWTWFIGIPTLAIIQLILSYSLNLFTATLNLFFRDTEKLVQMLMTFMFFLTPVVYKAEMVPKKFEALLLLNPFASLIISWRELFIRSELALNHIGIALCWAIALFIITQVTYKKLSWRFAEVL
ncbi:MAG: ABC transporter permease [Peredibacter sp.]|nr:ABC transporter permease [Peredibacter sp.]